MAKKHSGYKSAEPKSRGELPSMARTMKHEGTPPLGRANGSFGNRQNRGSGKLARED